VIGLQSYRIDRRQTWKRLIGLSSLVVSAAFLGGWAAVVHPVTAGIFAAAAGFAAIALPRPGGFRRTGEVVLLFGGLVLGYSFANLGVQTGLAPVPLTEILLIALLPGAFLAGNVPPRRFLGPILLFAGLVGVRLFFDYPQWKTLAIRDATIGIEVFLFVLGFQAIRTDGLERWIPRLKLLFVVLLCYASLYPVSAQLEAISPQVGLQYSVPLLGEYSGTATAAFAAMVFFGLFERGGKRVFLVLWALAFVAIFQTRGLYLAFPVAAIALAWCLRQPIKVALRGIAVATMALVVVLGLATVGVQGRVAPVSLDFYRAHIETLFGEQGPASGTIGQREEWARSTIRLWLQTPATVVFGVGLGPDLTFGFSGTGGVQVRKPHDDYIEILARAGIAGLFLFLLLIFRPLVEVGRMARHGSGDDSRFCSWVVTTCVVYLLVAATQPMFAFVFGTIPFFFFLGMGLAVALSAHDSRQSRPSHDDWSIVGWRESDGNALKHGALSRRGGRTIRRRSLKDD
jgi:O-antigen ligase